MKINYLLLYLYSIDKELCGIQQSDPYYFSNNNIINFLVYRIWWKQKHETRKK